MKKLVNGKVVDIKNMDLFELAAEGLILHNTTLSNTADGLDANIDTPLVKKYIKQYDILIKAMPYPLYAVEKSIKYATISNFIQNFSKEKIVMWVEDGLNMQLDIKTGMTLKVVNNTWSIVYVKEVKEDNTCMDNYGGEIGFEEYSWFLNKILGKESTADFYKEFMGEFVEACNNNPIVIKWELENMLTFSNIPNKLEIKNNTILDSRNNTVYSLDMFCNGEIESEDKSLCIRFGSDNRVVSSVKKIKTYDYETYCKKLGGVGSQSEKIIKCKIVGAANLFRELCGIKNANEFTEFPDFKGVVDESNLIFSVENRLYITKSNRVAEIKDIAYGVEIYAVENGKVFFIKNKKMNSKISKETLYSYNIADSKIKVCKIIFN